MKRFYITTAIDYPSAKFHLGHGYEKICTDVIARWKRLNGFKVHFSTGTDCHGLKIQRNAEKANKEPLEFVTEISNGFRQLCEKLNISYDDFIMTTEDRHKKVARYIMKKLYKNEDIYKGVYEGPYCVDCETYYTERELADGNCHVHKRPVEMLKEESYFFALSKYKEFLVDYITNNPDCILPEKKRTEILNRLKEPLRDLSISRRDVKWGIPLPFDKKLTEFVWVEALNNYLTTINYPGKGYRLFWPAVHMIGPDIVWHHTAIWFPILRSLKLEMPKVVVHGFINLKGEKLSKATCVRIDPIELVDTYGTDSLRYFLVREIPFGEDGDFSEKALIDRHNNELANDLGNLVSRVLTLAEKNFESVHKTSIDKDIKSKLNLEKIKEHIEKYELHVAIAEIWKFINEANKYVNEKRPWELKGKKLEKCIYNLLESIRIISILVSPFMPGTSTRIDEQLCVKSGILKECKFGFVKEYKVKKGEILFKKI